MSNYNIKMAAQLSGVTELSIRSWEGRYSAVIPNRTVTNRRLYSDSDIEKLALLKKLTQYGHRIGELANLSIPKLLELVSKIELKESSTNKSISKSFSCDAKIVTDCIEELRKYNDKQLTMLLNTASVKYNQVQLIEKVIIPLIEKIGSYWKEGLLRISHEHFASAIIVKFLNSLSDGFKVQETAPRIVFATPEGQYHEVGALIGASLAASNGWKTTYLGASLPAEDISSAIKQLNARCVFLSITYPDDNLAMNSELRKLREMVGDDVFIIVNGNSASGYKNTLQQINASIIESPKEFSDLLQAIRKKINPNNGAENE